MMVNENVLQYCINRTFGHCVAACDSVRPSCRPSTNTLFTGMLRCLLVCPPFKVRSASSRSPRPNDRWYSCLGRGASRSFGVCSVLLTAWIDRVEIGTFSASKELSPPACHPKVAVGSVYVVRRRRQLSANKRSCEKYATQVLKPNIPEVMTRKSISCRKNLLALGCLENRTTLRNS